MSEKKEKRNQELYQDFKAGKPILDIQIKYRLSHGRIYAIIKLYKKENI
jgi:Mor family transcriptional regulator